MSATTEDIAGHGYVLTPGRHVGAEDVEDDGEPFEEKMARLTAKLEEQFAESTRLESEIRTELMRAIIYLPYQNMLGWKWPGAAEVAPENVLASRAP